MLNSLLEAMAFGIPAITTNVGGIENLYSDKINAILVNKYDKNLIVKKINELHSNLELYKSISNNNFLKAKKEFYSDVVAQRLLRLISEVSA